MIEKIYKKKTKSEKGIYKMCAAFSHAKRFFCVYLFSVAYFCTLQDNATFPEH